MRMEEMLKTVFANEREAGKREGFAEGIEKARGCLGDYIAQLDDGNSSKFTLGIVDRNIRALTYEDKQ